jgi:hypothetical protein
MAPSTAAETLDKIIIIIAIVIVIVVVPVVRIADLCISILLSGHGLVISDEPNDKFSNGGKRLGYVESSFLSRHRA